MGKISRPLFLLLIGEIIFLSAIIGYSSHSFVWFVGIFAVLFGLIFTKPKLIAFTFSAVWGFFVAMLYAYSTQDSSFVEKGIVGVVSYVVAYLIHKKAIEHIVKKQEKEKKKEEEEIKRKIKENLEIRQMAANISREKRDQANHIYKALWDE